MALDNRCGGRDRVAATPVIPRLVRGIRNRTVRAAKGPPDKPGDDGERDSQTQSRKCGRTSRHIRFSEFITRSCGILMPQLSSARMPANPNSSFNAPSRSTT